MIRLSLSSRITELGLHSLSWRSLDLQYDAIYQSDKSFLSTLRVASTRLIRGLQRLGEERSSPRLHVSLKAVQREPRKTRHGHRSYRDTPSILCNTELAAAARCLICVGAQSE